MVTLKMTARQEERSVSSGLKSGFEAVIHAFYADVFRYAFFLSRNRAQAEDLTHETFDAPPTPYCEAKLLQGREAPGRVGRSDLQPGSVRLTVRSRNRLNHG
jgi:hypothetical protein